MGSAQFDPASGLIFFSCGAGYLDVYREKSPDEYESEGGVPTEPGAKVMAFDRVTKKIFLPAVRYQPEVNMAGPPLTPKPAASVVVVVAKS
ncbi:MAG: hypothetical protein ACREDR_26025 [Blastocatellia bacterium]